jgi:peptidoglycan/xylan/chitin deacetylase (PgdA/CDA1 family)
VVTLTYDDGPDPVWTPAVLDALAEHDAQATFFVLGLAAQQHPDLIARMRAEGHEVALHADHHVRHTELTGPRIAADAAAALERLAHLEVRPRRWRTPWGTVTSDTHMVADRLELELVHWTLDTHDWRGHGAPTMFGECAAGITAGAVVLMHDGIGPGARRAGCFATVELTHRFLELASARGLAARSLHDVAMAEVAA